MAALLDRSGGAEAARRTLRRLRPRSGTMPSAAFDRPIADLVKVHSSDRANRALLRVSGRKGTGVAGVLGRVTVLSALVAYLAVYGSASAEAPKGLVEILSIRDIRLGVDEYIDAFTIRTQGVEILAACRVPFGWHVSLGAYDAVEGDLKGEAGLGASFINNGDLDRLNGLFLVRVEDFAEKWNGSLPPSYRLSVHVGRYGHSDGKGRRLSLPLKNLGRVPARTCPPPVL